ncbi:hypothetical protein LIV57_20600 [Chryseobacterium sp. X308]|uniref:hypothetical protein n=1 Tax=Chryseobacterium sp. X308 TaxID=2884873 RepID=UPI001D15A3DC|nr:hypothetical protein [Chryseobacterium sp. X308]MCC3217668.1 hypothetical protein [Chryseobacterium sp. X308]
MPQTEAEELHKRLEKETHAHAQQKHLNENTDLKNENKKKDIPLTEESRKRRGLLNSVSENASFIKKTLKTTAIGLAAGFALGLLFPPLGIAVMAISAIAGAIAVGAKVSNSYDKTKAKNTYSEENTDAKVEILREIVRELMEEKLSKDKEEIKQQDKKNGIEDDSKQNIETLTGNSRRKAENITGNVIKNATDNDPKLPFDSRTKNAGTDHSRKSATHTNESRLAMFTKPLNRLNPDIKQHAQASKPKVQQETQSISKNMGMRRNTL